MSTACELSSWIHAVDPYVDFDGAGFKLDLQGWNSERPVFRELIELTRPGLILEIGAWKGASAIHMAQTLHELGLTRSKILSIDTWLGSPDCWQPQSGLYKSLRLKNGYPHLYDQFLFNVIESAWTQTIIPFPQTSLGAACWLKKKSLTAPLIYMDGGHEAEEVLSDLKNYYEILSCGGIIFGDDFGDPSGGVRQAVEAFARMNRLPFETREDQFWLFRKK